jgi:hypothetical protein
MRFLTTILAATGAPAHSSPPPLAPAPDRSTVLAALRGAAGDAGVHDAVVDARAWLARHGEDALVRGALAALLERVQPAPGRPALDRLD